MHTVNLEIICPGIYKDKWINGQTDKAKSTRICFETIVKCWQLKLWSDSYKLYLFYKKKFKIGGGSYGDVYEAMILRDDGQETKVAAKIIHKQAEDVESEIQNEIKFLKSCKHTNIVSFFGTTVERGKLVIVMEYAECGSLSNFLHGRN